MIPTLPRDLLASDEEAEDEHGIIACSKNNDITNADNGKKKKRTKKRWKKKTKSKSYAKFPGADDTNEVVPLVGEPVKATGSKESKGKETMKVESVKASNKGAATKKKKYWKQRRPVKKQNDAHAQQEQ